MRGSSIDIPKANADTPVAIAATRNQDSNGIKVKRTGCEPEKRLNLLFTLLDEICEVVEVLVS